MPRCHDRTAELRAMHSALAGCIHAHHTRDPARPALVMLPGTLPKCTLQSDGYLKGKQHLHSSCRPRAAASSVVLPPTNPFPPQARSTQWEPACACMLLNWPGTLGQQTTRGFRA